MPKRKTLGWLSFLSACLWLCFDYLAVKDPPKLRYAIAYGWATIALAVAHIWA